MIKLENVMTPIPFAASETETVHEAHARMAALQIRHLPVLREGRLVGVVSQRDLGRLITMTAGEPSNMRIGDAMSPDPYAVDMRAPLTEVARTMASKRYGCVLALDGEEVRGIFTTTDAMETLAELTS